MLIAEFHFLFLSEVKYFIITQQNPWENLKFANTEIPVLLGILKPSG
jgi:hypothetical protein